MPREMCFQLGQGLRRAFPDDPWAQDVKLDFRKSSDNRILPQKALLWTASNLDAGNYCVLGDIEDTLQLAASGQKIPRWGRPRTS